MTTSWNTWIPFLVDLLTPISDIAIEAYLNSDDIAASKWLSYMYGYVDLTFKDIENLTVPELSILAYCTNKRMKREQERSPF